MNKNGNGNGILKLFYFPISFYSQRAVFTLYEKGLSFEPVIVNIQAGEQYKPEYLQLNPNGTVPTLQDGVKVIPDSTDIMEYLEDNFSNGKFPRLLPTDKSSETYQKVMAFTEEFVKLEIPILTYGTFHNETLRKNVRLYPQIVIRKLVQKTRSAREDETVLTSTLTRAAAEVPEARDVLEKKAERMRNFARDIVDPARHEGVLRSVDAFLQSVEDELVTHTGDRVNWWLCGPTFSLADIDLCVLLNRIWALGLEQRLFSRTRPHVATYFRRARQRPAFLKTTAVPAKIRLLLVLEKVGSYLPLVLGVGAVLAAAYGIYSARR